MKLTRRNFLLGTAIATTSVATSRQNVFGRSGIFRSLASGNPLKIPPVITGGNLTIAAGKSEIFSGVQTDVYTINGSYPAPMIRIKKGEQFSAHITNNLSGDCVLHWHGFHLPAEMDGHPKFAIASGQSADITFPIINRAGTYFYHAHTDMRTAEQVYRGIAGMFIVDDDEDTALPLPKGFYDIPLMISDKHFDDSKQLSYKPNALDLRGGFLGETILVNGTLDAYHNVAPTLYRFRVLNNSNARTYKLALSNDASFTVIGTDGGLIEKPVTVKSCFLAPAERLDILIDFSSYQPGTEITLKSISFSYDGPPSSSSVNEGAVLNILRFDVSGPGTTAAQLPAVLSTIVAYKEADAVRTRQFTLFHSGSMHMINGLSFSMDRIDYTIPFGELEIWEFINNTTEIHPMHIHGLQFQVLDRSSSSVLLTNDLGWKDTVMVAGLDTVRVLVKFDTYDGLFLLHCHNLEHEDHGMMLNILVKKQNGVFQEKHSATQFQISPNPAREITTVYVSELPTPRELIVTTISGVPIFQQTIEAGVRSVALRLNDLSSGEYIVSIDGLTKVLNVIH